MDRLKENTHPNEDGFSMEVEGTVYTDKRPRAAILAACKAMTSPEPVPWASTGLCYGPVL